MRRWGGLVPVGVLSKPSLPERSLRRLGCEEMMSSVGNHGGSIPFLDSSIPHRALVSQGGGR